MLGHLDIYVIYLSHLCISYNDKSGCYKDQKANLTVSISILGKHFKRLFDENLMKTAHRPELTQNNINYSRWMALFHSICAKTLYSV